MNNINTPTPTRTRSIRRRVCAVALVAGLGIAACGSDDATSSEAATEAGAVTIADAWSRQPAEGQTTSAVYAMVTNGTDADITAIGATTDISTTVELHQVTMNDEGQMSMSEKEGGYTIAAGETFAFEPGGPHIMLLDVDAATYPDMVDITLEFDDGTTFAFTAEVREIGDTDMDGEMDEEMEPVSTDV